ncbi:MAG: glycosyltransferase family 4 protein [Anaerolineae bacterium]|nr:glycosyltransferase family 4 protein [Phycisphaerae bacterium]
MKILFLNPIGELGGAERMLLDVMASLREVLPNDSSMHLILMADGPLRAAAEVLGARVHVVPMPASLAKTGSSAGTLRLIARGVLGLPSVWSFTGLLRAMIRSINPDVIHSNGVKTHLLTRFIASAAPGAVCVWHVHDLLGERPMLAKLLRRFTSRVSCAVAISQAVASDLRTMLPRVTVKTVLNAIDVDHFSPGPANRATLDRSADESLVRIGLVATYARWKGHEIFLQAAAAARAARPGAAMRFYIIGGPIYSTAGSQCDRNELVHRAKELGILEHLSFVDFQLDPLLVYRALDIVVHASTRPEPFGRTIAEAMACGRAVIVSQAGGASELFEPDVDAIGVPPGDVTALAAAIVRLADDASLRCQIGESARRRAVERFDRRRLGPAIYAVYQDFGRSQP